MGGGGGGSVINSLIGGIKCVDTAGISSTRWGLGERLFTKKVGGFSIEFEKW